MYKIYKHTSPSGKAYIGQTKQLVDKRWLNGLGYTNCPKFWRAIQKYGWNNFSHEILEEVETVEEAIEREQYYIDLYDSIAQGYNIKPAGNHEWTEEMKEKARQSKLGKPLSEDHKKHLKENHKGFLGLHHSKETKNKIISNQPNAKPVICLETGEIFPSCGAAARAVNIKSRGNIRECCNGNSRYSTVGGFHWGWYKEESPDEEE